MAIKYIPYYPDTLEGQALLDNFVRTRRTLRYRDNDRIVQRISRGMPLYEVDRQEQVGDNPHHNLLVQGECLSACAYLKEQGIEVDLVYIDPPFASGADYAKKVYLRRNPLVQKALDEAAQNLDNSEMQAFEEKMYGDIWDKERYLNWMYENLMAIKSVMSERASIYVHLDYHIGHYVKILMDEIFGEENFRNEIVWHYYNKMQGNVNRFASNHDTIYFYSKSNDFFFTAIKEKRLEKTKQIKRVWNKEKQKLVNAKDENGKVIYIETDEKSIDDVWRISMLQPADKEEPLDYATQKPEALLERIIKASSDEGMLVADFFGGSGVTAAVAHKLGRRFVHGDVNVNSLQTTRDRLVAIGAQFDVMRVRDGVSLFRNPVQTMDKLKSRLITGLNADAQLDSRYWAGSITHSRYGRMPVYLPNLLDSSKRVLDINEMNTIMRKALPDLPDDVARVVVYYVDVDDMAALRQFIHDAGGNTLVEVELRDLKQVLDDVVAEDEATWSLEEHRADIFNAQWVLTLKTFRSDRVRRKIDEHNQRGEQQVAKKLADGKKARFVPISISDEGLETVEWLSLDCQTADPQAPWHSTVETRIERDGTATVDGTPSGTVWDGTIVSPQKPLRLKVRNVCGDETIYVL